MARAQRFNERSAWGAARHPIFFALNRGLCQETTFIHNMCGVGITTNLKNLSLHPKKFKRR